MNEVSNSLNFMQILYVEDDAGTLQEMTNLLKRHAGKFFTARDGTEGLEKYYAHHPDIIIVDLLMPKMGGLEMIKKLREAKEQCHVIITTALSDVDMILKAVDLGIDKYIIKPINIDTLLDELNKAALKKVKEKNLSAVIEGDNKRKIENEIKKTMTKFLKDNTGKGPKDVSIFITGNIVDITAIDTLTLMERKMIENGRNYAIIENNRKYFYLIKDKEICELLYDTIGKRAEIQQIVVNAERGMDKIKVILE
ncbi:response regulator [Sinanaerobacter chloroacetimidivorans]|uniref:Stage 0 sporulation protein A homolog n=1 Tax=Sinanaerobacter chloroacetimidivorans TaxID=2818044 RepID=A0A8J7W3W7_9FIRM|nr:response regulator [Sinanaerobacter chloroacetimidivorans]MBR0598621.1 response regulator [Sinanaerobacter chloroacetimidivorans]